MSVEVELYREVCALNRRARIALRWLLDEDHSGLGVTAQGIEALRVAGFLMVVPNLTNGAKCVSTPKGSAVQLEWL